MCIVSVFPPSASPSTPAVLADFPDQWRTGGGWHARWAHSTSWDAHGRGAKETGSYYLTKLLFIFFFGFIYYEAIVKHYPRVQDPPNNTAVALMNQGAPCAIGAVSCSNVTLSCCCGLSRNAHTYHSTGMLEYWPSLVIMAFFPCCLMVYMNAFTDFKRKIGGSPDGCPGACLCSVCCCCCVTAQQAQALDATARADTNLCGVSLHADGREPLLAPDPQVMNLEAAADVV